MRVTYHIEHTYAALEDNAEMLCWCKSRSRAAASGNVLRPAVSQCVLRKTYPLSNLLRTHTYSPILAATHTLYWCIPLVHTTGMPYQPATLQTCEPCPANRDNSQTTAAWSELSVVAHDRGLPSLPAGHNLYHSYQFNEWYRQIYSSLIQSEPKILYNIYYHLDRQSLISLFFRPS